MAPVIVDPLTTMPSPAWPLRLPALITSPPTDAPERSERPSPFDPVTLLPDWISISPVTSDAETTMPF